MKMQLIDKIQERFVDHDVCVHGEHIYLLEKNMLDFMKNMSEVAYKADIILRHNEHENAIRITRTKTLSVDDVWKKILL